MYNKILLCKYDSYSHSFINIKEYCFSYRKKFYSNLFEIIKIIKLIPKHFLHDILILIFIISLTPILLNHLVIMFSNYSDVTIGVNLAKLMHLLCITSKGLKYLRNSIRMYFLNSYFIWTY